MTVQAHHTVFDPPLEIKNSNELNQFPIIQVQTSKPNDSMSALNSSSTTDSIFGEHQ